MLEIRKVNATDLPLIYELGNKYLTWESWSRESIRRDIESSDRLYLVAEDNKVVVGYISFSFILDSADLLQIVVDKAYRNKGIATKLLESGKDILYGLGVLNIMLEVRESNDTAIRFYEKNNFKKISIREHYYQNENALIYSLIR